MTLPSSGNPISLSQVNQELRLSSTATISLDNSSVRSLFGAGSSPASINMDSGHSKEYRTTVSYTFTTHTSNFRLGISALSGYVSASTTATVTINSGIYLYSTTTGTPALTIGDYTSAVGSGVGYGSGDIVNITNNGYILGMGGAGGSSTYDGGNPGTPGQDGSAGGIGLSLTGTGSVNITNNGHICGGGGGGGSSSKPGGGGGGGGAGGGVSVRANPTGNQCPTCFYTAGGGAGGTINAQGADGAYADAKSSYLYYCACGGRNCWIKPYTLHPHFVIGSAGGGGRQTGGAAGAGGTVTCGYINYTNLCSVITAHYGQTCLRGRGGYIGGGGAAGYLYSYWCYICNSCCNPKPGKTIVANQIWGRGGAGGTTSTGGTGVYTTPAGGTAGYGGGGGGGWGSAGGSTTSGATTRSGGLGGSAISGTYTFVVTGSINS